MEAFWIVRNKLPTNRIFEFEFVSSCELITRAVKESDFFNVEYLLAIITIMVFVDEV